MTTLMAVLGTISTVLRAALFVLAVAAALVALSAWAVRTRRINPFSHLARSIRRVTDPVLAPIEKRLVISGKRVSNAPWWLLGGVVVGGLLLIATFDFLVRQLMAVNVAASSGPRGVLVLLVVWTFAILKIALLVRVIAGWIRLSAYNPVVRLSYRLTEWMLAPLRSVIPSVGMFDITPLIAWFLLSLLERVVVGLL